MKNNHASEHDLGLATDQRHSTRVIAPFGRRVAALGELVVPVAMLVGGLGSGLLQQDGVANTTCCPFL